jgi:signal transduction histidine kinase/CheY-like chemotaxis protein
MLHPNESPTLLIVDDEPANTELLEAFLGDEGYRLHSTNDSRDVLGLWEEIRPDLLLLDLHMPFMDGFSVMQQVRSVTPEDVYFPILVLTADVSDTVKERALASGAKDFLLKPLDAVEVQLRIRNLLETRLLHQRQREARFVAEAAERRAVLLGEASHLLGSSLDSSTTLSTLARYLVPAMADYCGIALVGEDGVPEIRGVAHADPALEPRLRVRLPQARPGADEHNLLVRALTGGEPVLLEEVDGDALPEAAATLSDGEDLVALRPRSLIHVPLQTSQEVAGAMMLIRSDGRPSFTSEDLRLAQELARRASLAVENARLFHAAQVALRERDQVLAVVAHDLRNPLSTVTMGSGMLLSSLPEQEHASDLKYVGMIQRAANRMEKLIQDLLDATRLESGKLRIEPRPESLALVLSEALEMHRLAATAEGIELRQDTSNALPPVLIDSARVQQVLSNLLGNALKFTPPGGEITVRARHHGERMCVVSISDTGPGIPPEQLQHIFGRFWQAQRNDRRGIGLGLAIAKGIVEAHGGEIWADSHLGSGSDFCFTLPYAAPPGSGDGGGPRGGNG